MSKIGVVVGRFQCSELTEGHKKLIDIAISENDQLLVIIGSSPSRNTKNEPLSSNCRQVMIQKYLSEELLENGYRHEKLHGMDTWTLTKKPLILIMEDVGNLPKWCQKLDILIDMFTVEDSVTIYGGRDSIVEYYKGKFSTMLIDNIPDISATKSRDDVCKKRQELFKSSDFRSGMIYASQWRFPTGFPTADVACVKDGKLLLCRKHNRDKFYLIGGFFDPTLDTCLEDTALRELREETGVIAIRPKYITNDIIKYDFRYKKETDKILTTLFQVDWVQGIPVANDDISGVEWIDIDELSKNVEKYIEIDHIRIVRKFLEVYKS